MQEIFSKNILINLNIYMINNQKVTKKIIYLQFQMLQIIKNSTNFYDTKSQSNKEYRTSKETLIPNNINLNSQNFNDLNLFSN